MKTRLPDKKALILLSALFIGYNLILFVLTGFSHTSAYWISYTFMIVAFAFFAFDLSLANVRQAKDYLLGLPILRHAAVYLGSELAASIVFMILDKKYNGVGKFAFAVQMIILVVHIVFVVLCLSSKEKIEELQEKTKANTGFMKALLADAEMLVIYAYDDELRKAFSAFAENVKYSDKVSVPELDEIESKLSLMTANAKQLLRDKDKETALKCCEEMMFTLDERNKKCKIYK